MAYLFNYTNDSYKTAYYVGKIMRQLYKAKPDGLCGNEDCGQMSAWYVMSALGFYPVNPCSGQYQIGMPIFDKAVVSFEDGKRFTITSSGNTPSSFYLQDMSLNKEPYQKLFLTYNDISKGGNWDVLMGKLPNQLFMQDLEKPVSAITDELILPNPYILDSKQLPGQKISIALACIDKDAKLYYTTDGTMPGSQASLYQNPVTVAKGTAIKFVAIKNGKQSFVVTASY